MNTKITYLFTLLLLTVGLISAQTVNIEGDPYSGNPYASITEAIDAASDGDVILISGIHTEVVTFGKSITLRGTNPVIDIIQAAESPSNDGTGESPISVIRAENEDVLNVTIENLGVRNGNSEENGGGIFIDKVTGLITLNNLIIEDNYTERNGGGVGIAGSNVDIINCTIQNNESGLDGGGILAAPNNASDTNIVINIEQSLIDNNLGRNGGGLFLNGNQNFGNDFLMDVNIINSTVSNNDTFSPAGGNGGGAIFSAARLWTTNPTVSNITLMLVHATFYGNTHAALPKSGIQFGSAAETNFSVYNSIVVSTDDVAVKALNFLNSNTTDVVNTILGGLENAGPFNTIIDDENKNNERGRPATFAGLTTGLTDQGGSTLVFALDEGSTSVDYCTAETGIDLPGVDQRGFARGDIPDAGAFEFDGELLSARSINKPEFSVYPNPARDFIQIDGLNGTVHDVKIYSVTGALQKQTKSTSINVSDLSSGVYLVKITGNDNNSVTKRVIVK